MLMHLDACTLAHAQHGHWARAVLTNSGLPSRTPDEDLDVCHFKLVPLCLRVERRTAAELISNGTR